MRHILKLFIFAVVLPAFAAQAPLSLSAHPTGTALINFYNAALAAVSSNQSGTVDPTTNGGAFSFWADTTNNLLKQRNAANTAWNTIAPLGAQLLPIAGGSLTGNLAAPGILITGAAGTDRALSYQTSGVQRWVVDTNGSTETGSNNGSDFVVYRYSDAGSYLATPFYCVRSNGSCGFEVAPAFPTPTVADNSTKGATTAFIAAKSAARTAFNYHQSSSQTSGTTLAFGAATFAFHGAGSFSGTEFTAAITGLYHFDFNVLLANSSGFSSGVVMAMFQNSTSVCADTEYSVNGQQTTFNCGATLYLTAGDKVKVVSGTTLTGSLATIVSFGNVSTFSGYLIDSQL